MRCALIIPAWLPQEIFPARTALSQINYWQPLGTLYVAACLRRAGHEVLFLNGAFLSAAEILDQLQQFQPQVAGIYATAFGWPKALATAAAVKRLDPNIFTCAGGPYPIALQEQCLADASADLDAVVTGEAEQTMVELLARLEAGAALDGVAGVVFRRGAQVIRNAPRPPIEDLDTLPFPARELLGDSARYLPPPATYKRTPVAVMITSRGCSRHCLFCFQIDRHRRAGVHGVRYRSIDNVMQEIEHLLAQGYREIKFIDDSFAADRERAMRLARAIQARGLDFSWFASACVNQVDRPLLQAMKDAGCWAILLGAESGVQKNLNTLRKGSTLAQIRSAVRAAQEVGLTVSTPFVFGIPGETYAEALQTIDFAIDLDPDLANFHALTPFPGTDLYDRASEFGSVADDLADYSYQGAAFVPYTLTRSQIQQLRQLAIKRFYSRPRFLWRRLCSIRSWRDCQAAARGLKSLIGVWTESDLFRPRPTTPAGAAAKLRDG